jgi:ketosteroid isomerase-like protein
MKKLLMYNSASKSLRSVLLLSLGAAVLLISASPASAQKKKKDAPITPADSSAPLVPMGDQQAIDYTISEVLGAWQLGDIEKLHKDYAEDAVFVNGAYAPPTIGWTNYLPIFQQQHAHMQQIRMDRSNTYIKVDGNSAWACYQWDFAAKVDGQPVTAQGQATLVFSKKNNHWVIVHNHTSLVQMGAQTPASATPAAPQSPATKPQ